MIRGAVLLATRNAGKIVELRMLLAPLGRPLVDLATARIPYSGDEDAVENAATFEENAVAKARYFHERSGAPVIADDSGLCVAALGGEPGVRSRRYAGATGSEAAVSAANSARLLRALDGKPDRRAEFACAIAYVDGSETVVASGRTTGRILDVPAGTGGFGYDPLFWSDELGASFGDASEREKARVSHRARAVDGLLASFQSRSASVQGGVDANA